MIAILDYGMGNLRSVQKGFERVDYEAEVVSGAGEVDSCDLLVVPGVGAFDRAVKNLKASGLWEPVLRHLERDKPYLGICLGLQLLFEGSQEGDSEGFSVLSGEVVRFESVNPVPHMGWNEVEWIPRADFLYPENVDNPCYYFVHSFFPRPEDESLVAGRTEYGSRFPAAVLDGSRLGVQFHPEKSQAAGLELLRRFCDRVLS